MDSLFNVQGRVALVSGEYIFICDTHETLTVIDYQGEAQDLDFGSQRDLLRMVPKVRYSYIYRLLLTSNL